MVDLSIEGKHDDQPAVAPVYVDRVMGAGFDPGRIQVVGSCAEARAAVVVKSNTIYIPSTGSNWQWNATSTAADSGSETTTAIQIEGVTTGRWMPSSSLSLNSTLVNLTETPITSGSGAQTLWSRAIAESTDIEVEAHGTFSTAAGERWIGTLVCTAKRAGSGSLSITSQAAGIPWVLDDSLWNPVFDTSSNTLRFRVTADASASIVPRGTITYRETNTSADPAIPALPAARAAVVADGYAQLYFADAGLTPASPSVGTNITAWADQSGHNRHLNASAGDEPRYALDGAWPYLDLRADVGVFMIEASGLAPAASDMTFRWTIEKTDNGTASIEILTALTTFWVFLHNGAANLSAGVNIALPNVGTAGMLAPCPTGKHDIELRLNRSTLTATLYIDGVLVGTKAYVDFTPARYPTLGYTGTQYQPVAHIYAWAYKTSLGTDDEMTRWIAFSQLAFGPHD